MKHSAFTGGVERTDLIFTFTPKKIPSSLVQTPIRIRIFQKLTKIKKLIMKDINIDCEIF